MYSDVFPIHIYGEGEIERERERERELLHISFCFFPLLPSTMCLRLIHLVALSQDFSTSALVTFGAGPFFLVGAVLCIVG